MPIHSLRANDGKQRELHIRYVHQAIWGLPNVGHQQKKHIDKLVHPGLSVQTQTHTRHTPALPKRTESAAAIFTGSHPASVVHNSWANLLQGSIKELPNLNKGNGPSLPTTMEAGQGADGMGWKTSIIQTKPAVHCHDCWKTIHLTLQFGVQNHLSIWPSTESSLCLIQQENAHNHPARINSQ